MIPASSPAQPGFLLAIGRPTVDPSLAISEIAEFYRTSLTLTLGGRLQAKSKASISNEPIGSQAGPLSSLRDLELHPPGAALDHLNVP
jgi:hypothetical protein